MRSVTSRPVSVSCRQGEGVKGQTGPEVTLRALTLVVMVTVVTWSGRVGNWPVTKLSKFEHIFGLLQ